MQFKTKDKNKRKARGAVMAFFTSEEKSASSKRKKFPEFSMTPRDCAETSLEERNGVGIARAARKTNL